jgi:glycosyltransferase involved in cell wall biosynthesis
LLEKEEYAQKLAEKSYEFVMKNLTWEIVLPKYIEFYEKLITT